jgi:hypothetical protein
VFDDCSAADCRVVLEFGRGNAVRLPWAVGRLGVGLGDTPAAAEAVALDECRRDGQDCRVAPAQCNR